MAPDGNIEELKPRQSRQVGKCPIEVVSSQIEESQIHQVSHILDGPLELVIRKTGTFQIGQIEESGRLEESRQFVSTQMELTKRRLEGRAQVFRKSAL